MRNPAMRFEWLNTSTGRAISNQVKISGELNAPDWRDNYADLLIDQHEFRRAFLCAASASSMGLLRRRLSATRYLLERRRRASR
jgi:hypothetical protein